MRGCLTLVLGFLLGAGLMLYWWPRPPHGVALPASADLRATVSDSYLTRLVATRAAGIQFPTVTHVQVLSNPPATLVVDANVSAATVTAPLVMALQPVAQNGRVQVQVVSASLAGIPVPAQLTGIVEEQINHAVNRVAGTDARITGVLITGQGMTVTATMP